MKRLSGGLNGFTGQSVDRRRFLESAAVVGAMTSIEASICGQAAAAKATSDASANSVLPDGTEFVRWEQPLTFSKTYYVDNTSPSADDNGPGDKTRPFRTINKAAQCCRQVNGSSSLPEPIASVSDRCAAAPAPPR